MVRTCLLLIFAHLQFVALSWGQFDAGDQFPSGDGDNRNGHGFWSIRLSPESIASVPFGAGHIAVWEHAGTPGRFYYMPLAYLLSGSASTQHNILTGMHEMNFDVLMWSLEAREAVYRHLKEDSDRPDVSLDDVEMLPMEKVRLVWKGDAFRERLPTSPRLGEVRSEGYGSSFWLQDRWQANTHLPAKARFTFTCLSDDTCLRLANAMKETPSMFHHLELEYIINGQSSARRKVSVAGSTILNGELFTSLVNMAEAGSSQERYVNSNDLKTIISQSALDVMASVTTDADYIDTGDEISVKNLLERVLGRDEVSVESFEPHMWSSVFWNPSWARPDKLVSYLNKALEKDDNDTKHFVVTENAWEKSSGGGGNFDVFGIKFGGKKSGSGKGSDKVERETVLNALRERHDQVEWTGEVFRVKPTKLYRLNLSTLNATSTLAVADVQIHRYELVERMAVRVHGGEHELTPTLTPELVLSRLRGELEETSEELSKLITHATTVCQEKLSSSLASLRSETAQKLDAARKDAEKKLVQKTRNVLRCDETVRFKSWKGDYLHRPDSRQGVTSWHTGIGNVWNIICHA